MRINSIIGNFRIYSKRQEHDTKCSKPIQANNIYFKGFFGDIFEKAADAVFDAALQGIDKGCEIYNEKLVIPAFCEYAINTSFETRFDNAKRVLNNVKSDKSVHAPVLEVSNSDIAEIQSSHSRIFNSKIGKIEPTDLFRDACGFQDNYHINRDEALKKLALGYWFISCNLINSHVEGLYENIDCYDKILNLSMDSKSSINMLAHRKTNLYYDANNTSLIPNIEYACPDSNIAKSYYEHFKFKFSFLKECHFSNFQSEEQTLDCKDLTLEKNNKIKKLIISEPNAKVTIIGNSNKIDEIEFLKGGSVVYKKDENGIAPSAKIKIINASVERDYPKTGLDNVVGMEELKRELQEDIIEPLKNKEKYQEYGLECINGFLLYGPPGCGKTFLIENLAQETERYLVQITPSNVGSAYQHQTASNIAQKFSEAKNNAPSIVFIDEIEALAPKREGLSGECASDINEQVTELLQQMNNCKDKDILIVCASNEPQMIDKAIKRTGRLDKKIFLPPPDIETRQELFNSYLSNVKRKQNNINIEKLAELTQCFTAEEIKMIVREASKMALRNDELVSEGHLLQAIAKAQPELDEKTVEYYKTKGEI